MRPRPLPTAALTLLALASVGLAQRGMVPSSEGSYVGATQPSKTVDLAFDNLGKVSAVEVKAGDTVEAGQVLMVQDARAEEARLRRLQEEADVAARVRVAEERRDLAALQADRAETNLRQGSGTQVEVEEAMLERKIAETQILEEQRQGRAAEASVQEIRVTIDQKELVAPVAGVVREVEAQVGEIFGPQTPALQIVAIDPIEVEAIEIPNEVVAGLSLGDTLGVRFPGEGEYRDATLTFIDPVADRSVSTRRIRLTLPNPDRRLAGEWVEVRLPG